MPSGFSDFQVYACCLVCARTVDSWLWMCVYVCHYLQSEDLSLYINQEERLLRHSRPQGNMLRSDTLHAHHLTPAFPPSFQSWNPSPIDEKTTRPLLEEKEFCQLPVVYLLHKKKFIHIINDMLMYACIIACVHSVFGKVLYSREMVSQQQVATAGSRIISWICSNSSTSLSPVNMHVLVQTQCFFTWLLLMCIPFSFLPVLLCMCVMPTTESFHYDSQNSVPEFYACFCVFEVKWLVCPVAWVQDNVSITGFSKDYCCCAGKPSTAAAFNFNLPKTLRVTLLLSCMSYMLDNN